MSVEYIHRDGSESQDEETLETPLEVPKKHDLSQQSQENSQASEEDSEDLGPETESFYDETTSLASPAHFRQRIPIRLVLVLLAQNSQEIGEKMRKSLSNVNQLVTACLVLTEDFKPADLEVVGRELKQSGLISGLINRERNSRGHPLEIALGKAGELSQNFPGFWYALLLIPGEVLEWSSQVPPLERLLEKRLDCYTLVIGLNESQREKALLRLTNLHWIWKSGVGLSPENREPTRGTIYGYRIQRPTEKSPKNPFEEAQRFHWLAETSDLPEIERIKMLCRAAQAYQEAGLVEMTGACYRQLIREVKNERLQDLIREKLNSLDELSTEDSTSEDSLSELIWEKLQIHNQNPGRFETTHHLLSLLVETNQYYLAWILGMSSVKAHDSRREVIESSEGSEIEKWQFYDLLGAISIKLGHRRTARELLERSLREATIPEIERNRIRENLRLVGGSDPN